jgi:hypothetical protein
VRHSANTLFPTNCIVQLISTRYFRPGPALSSPSSAFGSTSVHAFGNPFPLPDYRLGTGLPLIPLCQYLRLPILYEPLYSAISHTVLPRTRHSCHPPHQSLAIFYSAWHNNPAGMVQFAALPSRCQIHPFVGLVLVPAC